MNQAAHPRFFARPGFYIAAAVFLAVGSFVLAFGVHLSTGDEFGIAVVTRMAIALFVLCIVCGGGAVLTGIVRFARLSWGGVVALALAALLCAAAAWVLMD